MWNLFSIGILATLALQEMAVLTPRPTAEEPISYAREHKTRAQQPATLAMEQAAFRHFQQGEFEAAIAAYQKALSLTESDLPAQARILSQLGHTYANLANYDTALAKLDSAQQHYQTLQDNLGLAEVATYRGFVHRRQDDPITALSSLQSALEQLPTRTETTDDRQQIITGDALHNLGAVYVQLGDIESAIAHYNQALHLWQTPPAQTSPEAILAQQFYRGRTLNNLGIAYYTLGKLDQAETFYQQALTLAKVVGNRVSEGRILTNLALVAQQTDRYDQAEQRYQQALQIVSEAGDRASLLNSLGTLYETLGQYDKAQSSYQQALSLAETAQNPSQLGKAWDGLGGLHYLQANYGKALSAYQTALEIQQSVGDDATTAATLTNLGGTYEALGRYKTALGYFDQALALTAEDPYKKATILGAKGAVYQRLSDIDPALISTQEGLYFAQAAGDTALQSHLQAQLGSLYGQLGQLEPAIAAYQIALTLAQTSQDPSATGRRLNSLSDFTARQGDLEQAQALSQAALSQFRLADDLQGESTALANLGKLYDTAAQPVLAILFYKQAITRHESIRDNLTSLPNDLQQSYLDSITPTYRRLADLLLQQDRVLEAQRVIDLLKVQELDDYLRGVRGNDDTQAGVDNASAEQQIWNEYEQLNESAIAIARALQALRNLDRPLTPEETQQKAQLDKQQREIVRAFRHFSRRDDILKHIESLSYSAREQSLSLSRLPDISQNLRDLKSQSTLLYPLILEDRLELVVVAPGTPPTHTTVNVSRLELNQIIQAFRKDLRSPASDPRPNAQKLYDWLIRPVESQLTQAKTETILYAPDGVLRYIPLSALHDGNSWLVEQFQVNNITAASLDDLSSQPPTGRQILAGAFTNSAIRYEIAVGEQTFGFQGLPYAGVEIESLQALQPSSALYRDPEFTKASILPSMDDYPIVHFATHASFLPGSPLDSFILLGNGETITLQEVQDEWFFSNLDLVVLSACQTGLSGKDETGEEILGFGYLMQNAGANAAIASLWAVDDGGTQTLMSAFYTNLLQGNSTKAESLRQAQLTLINKGETSATSPRGGLRLISFADETEPQTWSRLSHPYYWSPFILIGNGQ